MQSERIRVEQDCRVNKNKNMKWNKTMVKKARAFLRGIAPIARMNPFVSPDKKSEGIAYVEQPPEGGIMTYFSGHKIPFPGLPDSEKVAQVSVIKGMIPMGIEWLHKSISEYLPKDPKLYCRFGREIYRLFNLLAERERGHYKKEKFIDDGKIRWEKIRDIICVLLEYDDFYRFVAQDVLSEIKIEEVKMHEEDMYWARFKNYNFKGEEEALEKWGDPRKKLKKKNDT